MKLWIIQGRCNYGIAMCVAAAPSAEKAKEMVTASFGYSRMQFETPVEPIGSTKGGARVVYMGSYIE